MKALYHRSMLEEALADKFSPRALKQIIRANLAQDRIWFQLGLHHHFHFDSSAFSAGNAYIESQYTLIRNLTGLPAKASAQRQALGRLLHSAQDFYAHSNYVALWVAANGGLEIVTPAQIDPLDATILNHPELHSGSTDLLREWIYFVPALLKLLPVQPTPRPDSHAAMHLDSPERGPLFAFVYAAAVQRTRIEYRQANDIVYLAGGETAQATFLV